MDLEINDVAELLSIPVATIEEWLVDGKIPAYRIKDEYRFSRIEIEDWMLSYKIDSIEGGERNINLGQNKFSLYRALHKGTVVHCMAGKTKEEVITNTMKIIAGELDFDSDVITELLLDRESLQPTAINNGIAVPHTRDSLLRAHQDVVAIAFLEEPIEYGALDGKPVDTLFFLFACKDKTHLQLLAKIAHFCNQKESMEFLRSHPNKKMILEHILAWESDISSK